MAKKTRANRGWFKLGAYAVVFSVSVWLGYMGTLSVYRAYFRLCACYYAAKHQDTFNRFADWLEPIYDNTLPNMQPNDPATTLMVEIASEAMAEEQSEVEKFAAKCLDRPLNLDRIQ